MNSASTSSTSSSSFYCHYSSCTNFANPLLPRHQRRRLKKEIPSLSATSLPLSPPPTAESEAISSGDSGVVFFKNTPPTSNFSCLTPTNSLSLLHKHRFVHNTRKKKRQCNAADRNNKSPPQNNNSGGDRKIESTSPLDVAKEKEKETLPDFVTITPRRGAEFRIHTVCLLSFVYFPKCVFLPP